MDRMVLVGCSSVIADTEWTTASVPALVDKANWKGLHAVWKCVEKVCASVRETTLRSKSPTTNPRTPPCGFCKATMRPKPMAGTIWGGTLAVARRLHTSAKRAVVSSSSKTMRRVSGVRPDGPAAAPFRVFRRAVTSLSVARWSGGAAGVAGGCVFSVQYAVAGRRSGSRSLAKVDKVPGARGPAVKACRAADSSPVWTRCRARSLRRLSLGAAVGF